MVFRILLKFVAAASLFLMASCSGPEAKKQKFIASGKSLYDKGEYTKAALQLKNAVQIDPKSAEAHYFLGLVELKNGNASRAYSSFARTIELNPQHMDAQVQVAKLLFMSGEKAKAWEKLSLVLKTDPNHEEGHLLQGALYLSDGEPGKAAVLMEKMLGKGSGREEVFALLATARRALHDDRAAEETLLKGLQKNDSSLLLHRELANLYAGESRLDETAGEIRKMMAIDPGNHTYAITLAGFMYGKGDKAGALTELQRMQARFPGKEEAILGAAGFLVSRKENAEAEGVLTRGISAVPGSCKLRVALAEVMAAKGNADKALTLLKECLQQKKKPNHPDIITAKVHLARMYQALGQFKEAAGFTEEVLKASPHNTDAMLLNGQLLMQQGDMSKAIAVFNAYLSDQPKSLPGYLLLAKAQMANKDLNLALQTLQTAQKAWPDSPELRHAFVTYFVGGNDARRAESFLTEQLKKRPADPAIKTELASLYVSTRNYTKATSIFSDIKKKYPRSPVGYLKMGELLLIQGKGNPAIAEFDRAAGVSPSDDNILRLLVQTCIAQKSPDAALNRCQARIARDQRDNIARIYLGELYVAKGDFRRAEQAFAEARQYGGDPIAISTLLASMFTVEKDYRRARATYEELINSSPANWRAKNDFACFLADYGTAGEYDRALALAREADKARPGDPLIMDTIGWIHYRKGNLKDAEQMVRKAVAGLPSIGVIRYHLGMILFRSGNRNDARMELQKAATSTDFPGRREALQMVKNM